jgi:hypothetical protein
MKSSSLYISQLYGSLSVWQDWIQPTIDTLKEIDLELSTKDIKTQLETVTFAGGKHQPFPAEIPKEIKTFSNPLFEHLGSYLSIADLIEDIAKLIGAVYQKHPQKGPFVYPLLLIIDYAYSWYQLPSFQLTPITLHLLEGSVKNEATLWELLVEQVKLAALLERGLAFKKKQMGSTLYYGYPDEDKIAKAIEWHGVEKKKKLLSTG